ncbi:TIGR00730 family Rossman fold protein [Rhodobacteraceae bacterium NNCM2]|nr:TIGR00730 family Rossman fold protein [Coraliihabitans acroporae]
MSSLSPDICVFCGSRPGNRPIYADSAQQLGAGLAKAGFGLVYGAGDLGLMGQTARSARQAGGRVTGFIPRHLFHTEVGNPDIDALIITETMHERKKLMFGNSDAVVALPGGPGTLDELIEVLTWRQLALHERPVILVSPEGYWDPFLGLLDHIIGEGFAEVAFRSFFTVVETADEAIETLLQTFKPSN